MRSNSRTRTVRRDVLHRIASSDRRMASRVKAKGYDRQVYDGADGCEEE